MNPPPPSQTPAPVGRRWHWGWAVLLAVLMGIGALEWDAFTWQRAIRQLREAGIATSDDKSLGVQLWDAARKDWRLVFHAGSWEVPPIEVVIDPAAAGELRNLDEIAPALRRVNPEVLNLSGCFLLENVDGLEGLTMLRVIDLSDCLSLENVDGIKGHTALHVLNLEGCPALKNVTGLKGVASLRVVGLGGCTRLSLEELSALRTALPDTQFFWP